MRRPVAFAIGAGLALLLFLGLLYWGLQPRRPEADDKQDAERAAWMELAGKGDLDAYVRLQRAYKNELSFSLAEYWEFKGALAGEPSLKKGYLDKVRSMSAEARNKELSRIQKVDASKQNKILLSKEIEALPK